MVPIVLNYPIPGNDRGGLLQIYGDRNADDIVLYCGGYPDGVEPFAPLARRLAASSNLDDDDDGSRRCFVGVTCWPGFDHESFRRTKFRGFRREGYRFEEVARCIREAATRLFAEHDEPESVHQFAVIFHDLGVVAGTMFVNRCIEEELFFEREPDRVVLLDVLVGPHPRFEPKVSRGVAPYTRRENLVYLAYRGANACGFAASWHVSETFGVVVFWILCGIVRLLRLEPLRRIDNALLARRRMALYHLVYATYPYYHLFRALAHDKRALAHASLPLDLARTPVLYIYGSDKNVNFHDHRSLAILEREETHGASECRVARVDGAGHWMYCQRPDACEREIRQFLKGGGKRPADNEAVDESVHTLLSKL